MKHPWIVGLAVLIGALAVGGLRIAAQPLAPAPALHQAGPAAQRILQHLRQTERGAVQVFFDRQGRPSDALAFFVREAKGWSRAQYLYRREGDQLVLWVNHPGYDRLDGDTRIVLIEAGVRAFAITPGKRSVRFRLVVAGPDAEVEVERVVPLASKRPPRT